MILRDLGTDPTSGRRIVIKDGQYGPYATDGQINVSLNPAIRIELDTSGPKPLAETQHLDVVNEITLSQATVLLERKASSGKNQYSQVLGTDPANGRTVSVKDYGGSPFVADGELNVTLPEGIERTTVTLDFACHLLQLRRDGVVACGECGVYGHTRRTCPIIKERDKRQLARACSKCGQPGHTARSCANDLDLGDVNALIEQAARDDALTWRESTRWSGGEVYYRSRTLFQWLGRVADLKRQKRYPEAATLLIHLVAGEELGNTKDAGTPTSACFQDLAIVLQRMGETAAEIQLLERWGRAYPGHKDRFEDRLAKAYARRDAAHAKAAKKAAARGPRRCGACGETGHNKQTCTAKT